MLPSRRRLLKSSGSAALLAAARLALPALDTLTAVPADALRTGLAADPLRPQFHLLPAKNWMNDPNGPIYWKGRYHMFYQYNPNAAVWGDMHWAHAVSDDMVHWHHLPVALAPTPGWDDADGCFTGSAVDDHGTATILYTGVKTATPDRATLRDGVHNFREVQCLATSTDPRLCSWTKWKTPVIEPPHEPRLTGFRDPFLWPDGDHWYLGVASGLRREGGNILLYRSKDLRRWEYLHPLVQGQWSGRDRVNPVDSGEMWECPDFFALGNKHVLLYSTAGGVYWETGDLDPNELLFHTQRRGILDHGAYYAQKTQLDAHGNRILWGWIPETRPEAEFSAAGWAGCMALPRVLSLNSDSELEMRIASEVQSLRTKHFAGDLERGPVPPAGLPHVTIEGLAGEWHWTILGDYLRSGRLARAEFQLEDNAGSWLSLSMEPPENLISRLTVSGKSVDLPANEASARELRLFVDGSVAELICDNRHAVTTRIYRKPRGPLRVHGNFAAFHAWQLRPISHNRLTT
jgi:beta-fructofuranosidase